MDRGLPAGGRSLLRAQVVGDGTPPKHPKLFSLIGLRMDTTGTSCWSAASQGREMGWQMVRREVTWGGCRKVFLL